LLPAIAAVAAIGAAVTPTSAATAAVTTASATAATMAASAAVTAAAAGTSTSAATAGTFGLRPRFVYDQVPAAEILTVQGVDRAVSVFVVIYFNESETTRLSCETITD
jgi:hypothetical protein